MWGGWLLVTAAVFSFMQGIYHAYYTVALAPAIGALVGMGVVTLWRLRRHPAASIASAAVVAGTAVWSYLLLNRTPDWNPWLRTAVIVVGVAAVALLLIPALFPPGPRRRPVRRNHASRKHASRKHASRKHASAAGRLPARAAVVAAVAGLAAVLLGPAAYATATAATPHTGAIPSAGPAGAGGPGGRPMLRIVGPPNGAPLAGGQFPGGGAFPGGPGGVFPGGPGGMPGGQEFLPFGGTPGGGAGTGPGFAGPGRVTWRGVACPAEPCLAAAGPAGSWTRLPPATRSSRFSRRNADAYTWVAAAVGANSAAGYQLATGKPVMPIGGFNGSDPSPTLEQFQRYVEEGRIHYFLGGGRGMPGPGGLGGLGGSGGRTVGPGGQGQNGGSSYAQQISEWVQENFTSTTVDGVTVYDLTTPSATSSVSSPPTTT